MEAFFLKGRFIVDNRRAATIRNVSGIGALVVGWVLPYLFPNLPQISRWCIFACGIILLGAPLIKPKRPHETEDESPLEIIFDSTNPARRFWSKESPRDGSGAAKYGTFWEYRVEIKNKSTKTIRNVSVTTEHTGQMPVRPMDQIFDKIKKTSCDLKPYCSELVPVIGWPIPKIQAGMLSSGRSARRIRASKDNS